MRNSARIQRFGVVVLAACLAFGGAAFARTPPDGTLSANGFFDTAQGDVEGTNSTITIWFSGAVSSVYFTNLFTYDAFSYSIDGAVGEGLDGISDYQYFNDTGPNVVHGNFSYTFPLIIPPSTSTFNANVCCASDGLVHPGYDVFAVHPRYLEFGIGEPQGGPSVDYWVTIGDAAAPDRGIPEPAAWALMIAGFGLAGARLRRVRLTAPVRS